jgi:hypothetical protein
VRSGRGYRGAIVAIPAVTGLAIDGDALVLIDGDGAHPLRALRHCDRALACYWTGWS